MKRKLNRLYHMYSKTQDSEQKEQEFCRILELIESRHLYEIINHNRIKNRSHLYSVCREAVWNALEQYDKSKSSLSTYIHMKIKFKIKRETYNQTNDMFIIQIPYHAMVAYNNVYGKVVSKEELTGNIGKIGYEDIDCDIKDFETYVAVDRFLKRFDRKQCMVTDDSDDSIDTLVGMIEEVGGEDIHYDYIINLGMSDVDDTSFAEKYNIVHDISNMSRELVMNKYGMNKHQLSKIVSDFKEKLADIDKM